MKMKMRNNSYEDLFFRELFPYEIFYCFYTKGSVTFRKIKKSYAVCIFKEGISKYEIEKIYYFAPYILVSIKDNKI